MDIEIQGRNFTLKEGGQVLVTGTNGHKVVYYTGVVVTRDDLLVWATGFTAGKSKGWGDLV